MNVYGLKEPLLSPNAIKIRIDGKVLVAEWEVSHFHEEREQHSQESQFFEEGEAIVERITSRVTQPAKTVTLLNNYYWPPEGASAMQATLTLGRSSQQGANQQVFSLGMTILHACLM